MEYSERVRETESEVGEGVYRFQIEGDEGWYYGIDLAFVPQEHRGEVREDFEAASVLLNSLESLNAPRAALDSDEDYEIFVMEDMSIGKTDDIRSFYEAAAFHFLTSKGDVAGNIVEGSDGYAPIDFEGFSRSSLDENVRYLDNGVRWETDFELYKLSLAQIEIEAERHGIDFSHRKLARITEEVAEELEGVSQELIQEGYPERAGNIEDNRNLVFEGDII